MSDCDAGAKRNGVTAAIVTLDVARHIEVTPDRAYVVATADYAFQRNGKTDGQEGSLFTFALQKVQADWRFKGWSWSVNAALPPAGNEKPPRSKETN